MPTGEKAKARKQCLPQPAQESGDMPTQTSNETVRSYGINNWNMIPGNDESNIITDWCEGDTIQDLYPDDSTDLGLCPILSSPYLDDQDANSHNTHSVNEVFGCRTRAPFYQNDLDVLVKHASSLYIILTDLVARAMNVLWSRKTHLPTVVWYQNSQFKPRQFSHSRRRDKSRRTLRWLGWLCVIQMHPAIIWTNRHCQKAKDKIQEDALAVIEKQKRSILLEAHSAFELWEELHELAVLLGIALGEDDFAQQLSITKNKFTLLFTDTESLRSEEKEVHDGSCEGSNVLWLGELHSIDNPFLRIWLIRPMAELKLGDLLLILA